MDPPHPSQSTRVDRTPTTRAEPSRGRVRVRRARLLAVALLVTILMMFWFTSGWIRNIGGDIVIVVFLVSCLAALPVGRPRSRLLLVGLISVGVEGFQGLGLIDQDSHWLAHLTIGSTFDPVDFIAYLAGLVVALGAERWWRAADPSAPPHDRDRPPRAARPDRAPDP